jgi:UDP-N-acetyl-D-mannosaminuronic acid dehydrogenase
VHKTPEQAKLIRTAREVNDYKPQWVLGKIQSAVAALAATGKRTSAISVAFLGLSFKPNIDDLRESPALHIVEEFASAIDIQLKLVEPNIKTLPKSLGSHTLSPIDESVLNADIVVLLVNHQEFKDIKQRLGPNVVLIDAVGSTFNS